MADRRKMLTGLPKAAVPVLLLALLPLGRSACGSGTETTTTRIPPPVSASTADHLAKLSERVATYLDAGETCSAAHAADDLQAAIEDADLGDTIRPSVEETASRLVDG